MSLLRFSNLFQQRPARHAANFFVTRQPEMYPTTSHDLCRIQGAQNFDRQGTVGFHVEDAWTIELAILAAPRTLCHRAATMNRVRMPNYQNLSRITRLLKRLDDQMVTKVRDSYPVNRINARKLTSGGYQYLNHCATAGFITGGRFGFHERANKGLDIFLTGLQDAFELSSLDGGNKLVCHKNRYGYVIVSLRTVNASMRGKLI